MGTLLQLFPQITKYNSIGSIPIRRSEANDIALAMSCEQLFKRKGNKRVVILTKHGEIVLGIEKIRHIVQFYRSQGEISSIQLVTPAMASDLRGDLVPNITVA